MNNDNYMKILESIPNFGKKKIKNLKGGVLSQQLNTNRTILSHENINLNYKKKALEDSFRLLGQNSNALEQFISSINDFHLSKTDLGLLNQKYFVLTGHTSPHITTLFNQLDDDIGHGKNTMMNDFYKMLNRK